MSELAQIMEVRNDAFYSSQAQKLDMIFKKLNQTPHTELRWIWQLIQNAKDAPNKFGKVKIKQRLTDKHFISSHNGDAFNLKELHSVATQYSTKQQKNTQNIKTTGKYGTGFLTTHIISQKVIIQSILKFKKYQQKDPDEEVKIQEKEKSQQIKVQQTNLKSKKLNVKSTQGKSKKITQNNEKDQSKSKDQYYYMKFDNLILDRSYIDRDRQLPLKIKKAQKKLSQIASQAKYATKYGANKQLINYYEKKRNVDSFDTHFKYEIYDEKKFPIIERAVQNIKKLISYAFLFNPNLQYYEFIDQRAKDKNLSFSIKRIEMKNIIKKISIFKYQFSQKLDPKKKTFMTRKFGYILAKIHNDNPVAGIPIEITGDNWKILKVDQTLTQVFKQFPLIGSPPIKWNAVITSDQFYPNEQRSHLLLKTSNQQIQQRVLINKKNLSICFQGITQLYLYLAQYDCQSGLENLLILDQNNQYLIQNENLKIQIKQSIDKILKTNFIPVKKQGKNQKCKPKDLSFIQSKNKFPQNSLRKKFSMSINQIFAFLYPEKYLLDNQIYEKFYDVLDSKNSSQYLVLDNDQYIYYGDCLSKLQNLGFQGLQIQFGQKTFDKLHEIYDIQKNFNISSWNYVIFLNEDLQFVNFEDKMNKTINHTQQQLLDFLNIDFRSNIIHNQFVSHFLQELQDQQFNNQKMMELIRQKFNSFPYSVLRQPNQQQLIQLVQLLQILITFKVLPQKTYKKLIPFQIFHSIKQLKFSKSIKKQEILSDVFLNQLIQIFIKNLSYYFYHKIKNQSVVAFFQKNIRNIQLKQFITFLKDLFHDQVIGEKLSQIPIKLSANKNFVKETMLKKLQQGISLPNRKDIEIYNVLRRRNQPQILSELVLDIYPYQTLQKISQTTYKELFEKVLNNYRELDPLSKQKVLHYAESIHQNFTNTTCVDGTVAQKNDAFTNFLNDKHKKIFEIRELHPVFQNQKIKQFLYQIFDDPNKLQQQAQNYFKRNSPATTLFAKSTETSNTPSKKKKTD